LNGEFSIFVIIEALPFENRNLLLVQHYLDGHQRQRTNLEFQRPRDDASWGHMFGRTRYVLLCIAVITVATRKHEYRDHANDKNTDHKTRQQHPLSTMHLHLFSAME